MGYSNLISDPWGPRGTQEPGFSRLQNQGVKFLKHAEICPQAAEIMISTPLIRSIISWKIKDFSSKNIFRRLSCHSHKDAKKLPHHAKIFA